MTPPYPTRMVPQNLELKIVLPLWLSKTAKNHFTILQDYQFFISGIQHSRPANKLWTLFYFYFSTTFIQLRKNIFISIFPKNELQCWIRVIRMWVIRIVLGHQCCCFYAAQLIWFFKWLKRWFFKDKLDVLASEIRVYVFHGKQSNRNVVMLKQWYNT